MFFFHGGLKIILVPKYATYLFLVRKPKQVSWRLSIFENRWLNSQFYEERVAMTAIWKPNTVIEHLLPLRLIPVGDKRDKVCQLLVAYIWSLGTLGFLYKIRNTGSTQDIIPENCVFYDCAASSFLYLHEILISWPICKYIYKIGTDIAQNLEKKVVVAIHHWQWWIVIYFMYDLSL